MAPTLALGETEVGMQPSWLPPRLLNLSIPKPRFDAAQRAWGLSIAVYLFLGGVGAGAFAIAILLGWAGVVLEPLPTTLPGGVEIDLSALLLFWGPLLVAGDAALLLLHLGRNKHLFVTAGRKPRTAWLSRGFAILICFICTGGLLLLLAALAPGWLSGSPAAWRFLEVAGLLAALATATYTGMLLHSMRQIPAWHTALLPPLFVVSALATGALALALTVWIAHSVGVEAAGAGRLLDATTVAAVALLTIEAVLVTAYVRAVRRAGRSGERSVLLLLGGTWRAPFWLGVIGLGIISPAVLLVAAPAVTSPAVALAAVSGLAGGFVLRLSVLGIGIKDSPPLLSLSTWRAEAVRWPLGGSPGLSPEARAQ